MYFPFRSIRSLGSSLLEPISSLLYPIEFELNTPGGLHSTPLDVGLVYDGSYATTEFLSGVSAANPFLSIHRLPPVSLIPAQNNLIMTFEVL